MGVLVCRTLDSCERLEPKELSEGVPWKGIGSSGVRVSPVIFTGRQKREASELKLAKAFFSSEETKFVSFKYSKLDSNPLPVIPDCMMRLLG